MITVDAIVIANSIAGIVENCADDDAGIANDSCIWCND